jgi:hypothetical protein
VSVKKAKRIAADFGGFDWIGTEEPTPVQLGLVGCWGRTSVRVKDLGWWHLDVTAFFLSANRKAFVNEVMEFGYSRAEAKLMVDEIISAISAAHFDIIYSSVNKKKNKKIKLEETK